jgi:hypothetical protein
MIPPPSSSAVLVRLQDRMMARRSPQLVLTPLQVTTELTWRQAQKRLLTRETSKMSGWLVCGLRGSLRVVRCLGFPPCAADERKGPTGTLVRASRAYTRARPRCFFGREMVPLVVVMTRELS